MADWTANLPKPDYRSDDGSVVLYCADCMEILPQLPDGVVDAVVTDPPYGIGEARSNNQSRSCLAKSRNYGIESWDDLTQDRAVTKAIDIASHAVVFGGNYYHLPPSPCWLVWDKQNGKNDFADCELAWTNLNKAVRMIQWRWHGMIRRDNEERFHPTQKPLGVMEWCLSHLPANTNTILDPFMGSGTTGVACVKTGRKFIGIELSRKYFDIAVKRIEDAFADQGLFTGKVRGEKQSEIFA